MPDYFIPQMENPLECLHRVERVQHQTEFDPIWNVIAKHLKIQTFYLL